MSGRPYLSIGSKKPQLLIPPLDRAKIFSEAVLLGVAMEWLLGDKDVWSSELEYQLKRAITFDPTVGLRSKFSRACERQFCLG
jgi:hypothetical protein